MNKKWQRTESISEFEEMIASRSVSNPRWLLGTIHLQEIYFFHKEKNWILPKCQLISKVAKMICTLLLYCCEVQFGLFDRYGNWGKIIKSIEMNVVLFSYHLWNCLSVLVSSKMLLWLKKVIWGVEVRAGVKVQDENWIVFLGGFNNLPLDESLSVVSYLQFWFRFW